MNSQSVTKVGSWKLAARTDAPDFRDFTYKPALVGLASTLEVPKNLNIRDQGEEGACTGFGLAAAIDLLLARNDRDTRVSTRMLYEMARRYDEWEGEDSEGDEDEGSSCRGAIKGWYNMGVCDEQNYPYKAGAASELTVEAAKDARRNTIGAYYRLEKRISDYHAALTEVGVVYCSAMVHQGWEHPDSSSAIIEHQGKQEGGHAFAIVGYNDKGFWVQNSWGSKWGRKGIGLWLYEDWLENILDAWVFHLAVSTPQIWHLPSRDYAGIKSESRQKKPARAEIAGHFLHIDDGHFHDDGRYWSDLNDVKQTADLVAKSEKYDHLLFYAHGGLNSPTDSACRIAAMKETFKANRIYPYHFMYDTGLLEELKDVIIGRRSKAEKRAGGFLDRLDQLVEKTARVPGRALWREMKGGAGLPFESGNAGTEALTAFMRALSASPHPKKIHIAGHSTGMILLACLLQRLQTLAPDSWVTSASLMAPAGSIDLFTDTLQPLLKAPSGKFRISKMTIYNLVDDLEQSDEVTMAYNKSLLYLVSRSFEEQIPEKILGMQNYSKPIERRNLTRLDIHYSKGRIPGARVTASTSHGGFDNDPLTMNHVLSGILGRKPDKDKEFTESSLTY
jgi:hypothetical protein